MTRLIGSQWLHLRSLRSTWFTVVAIVVLGVVIAAADASEGFDRDTFVAGITLIPAVGLALLATAGTAGEFRYGTINQRLQAAPRRSHLVLARLATLLPLALVVASVTAVAALVAASASVPAASIIEAVSGAVLLTGLGVAVGFLVRNQTTAVLIVFGGWIGEKIVESFAGTAVGPYGLLDLLASGEPAAGLGLAALTAVALVAATVHLDRKDVN